eukprot:CAMPEP_0202716502 /NCGR_PEP_ID=MMETSP1385-20130828/102030_1 /ASSEMBLY_ACC=CAM_ASM_000861 /TAXON_ID=933848 /ORGANISM="Elphidium margaritaceum" /LENGTH=110 /DNA_ID=CAMNT_0049378283 /DNA_START=1 /DNA_END=333 /DNA_ORIENTATION=-
MARSYMAQVLKQALNDKEVCAAWIEIVQSHVDQINKQAVNVKKVRELAGGLLDQPLKEMREEHLKFLRPFLEAKKSSGTGIEGSPRRNRAELLVPSENARIAKTGAQSTR